MLSNGVNLKLCARKLPVHATSDLILWKAEYFAFQVQRHLLPREVAEGVCDRHLPQRGVVHPRPDGPLRH